MIDGVGARAADAARLELLDQAGLGEPRRRLRAVALGAQLARASGARRARPAGRQRRLGARLGAPAVGVARRRPRRRRSRKPGNSIVCPPAWKRASSTRRRSQRRALAAGVLHLAGDRALPDQLVERAARRRRCSAAARSGAVNVAPAGRIASWASCAFLHLGLVGARRVGQVLGAVLGLRSAARAASSASLRQRRRVGAHVGDVAVLVEPLGGAHRALRGEAQLARRPPAAACWS